MPDFWIHTLGGELVLKDLKNCNWKKQLEKNKKTFILGCQGPDLFFYNDFLPWIKNKRGPKIGTMMHQAHTRSLFLESIDYIKKAQNSEGFDNLTSYFSGFMVHYAIDKNEHPFINARTKSSDEHKLFEMKLDTYFIRKYWNKRVHLLSPSSQIDIGTKLPSAIVNYYKNIAHEVFNVPLDADTVNDSYNDYKKVFDIFYSPKGHKKFFLNMLNPIMPIDLSICIYPTDVDNEVLTKEEFLEFENIFKKGIAEAAELIELVSAYLKDEVDKGPIEKAFDNISFSGEPTRY